MTTTTTACANTTCSKEFTPTKSNQKFCSDRCRAAGHRAKQSGLFGTPENAMPKKEEPKVLRMETPSVKPVEKFDMPEGLPPQASWIIRQQDRNIEKLQHQNDKLSDKVEQLTAERDKARNDLAEFKTETKIKDIEGAKPTGLGAILPNGIEGLLGNPYLGPVIGALASKLLAPGAASTNGDEANAMDAINGHIAQWLSNQAEEVQRGFADLIGSIMKMEADKVGGAIQQLNNVLQIGSTIHNQKADVTASGTYGYN